MQLKNFLKMLSLCNAILFTVQSISWSAPSVFQLTVDSQHGTVAERYKGSEQDKLVVIIQDAHRNLQAQENLAHIICELLPMLKSSSGVQVPFVGIEGAFDEYDLKKLRDYPIYEAKQIVGRDVVREGKLIGAEYASLLADTDFTLYGLEDKKQFAINFQDFFDITNKQASLLALFAGITQQIDDLKERVYNNELLVFDAETERYESGAISLIDLLSRIYTRADTLNINLFDYIALMQFRDVFLMRQKIDNNLLEEEIEKLSQTLSANELVVDIQKGYSSGAKTLYQDYKRGTIQEQYMLSALVAQAEKTDVSLALYPTVSAAVAYWRAYDLVNIPKILEEVKDITNVIMHRLAKTKDENTLIQCSATMRNLSVLMSLRATEEDVKRFKKSKETFSLDVMFKSIDMLSAHYTEVRDNNRPGRKHSVVSQINAVSEQSLQDINTIVEKIDEFYAVASERDKTMVENLLSVMSKRNQNIGVLVAGGYHTQGITDILRTKGIPYVTVNPNFDSSVEDIAYIERMTGQFGPINPLLTSTFQYSRVTASVGALYDIEWCRDLFNEIGIRFDGQGVISALDILNDRTVHAIDANDAILLDGKKLKLKADDIRAKAAQLHQRDGHEYKDIISAYNILANAFDDLANEINDLIADMRHAKESIMPNALRDKYTKRFAEILRPVLQVKLGGRIQIKENIELMLDRIRHGFLLRLEPAPSMNGASAENMNQAVTDDEELDKKTRPFFAAYPKPQLVLLESILGENEKRGQQKIIDHIQKAMFDDAFLQEVRAERLRRGFSDLDDESLRITVIFSIVIDIDYYRLFTQNELDLYMPISSMLKEEVEFLKEDVADAVISEAEAAENMLQEARKIIERLTVIVTDYQQPGQRFAYNNFLFLRYIDPPGTSVRFTAPTPSEPYGSVILPSRYSKAPNELRQLTDAEIAQVGLQPLLEMNREVRDEALLSRIFDMYMRERFERIGWDKARIEREKQALIEVVQQESITGAVGKAFLNRTKTKRSPIDGRIIEGKVLIAHEGRGITSPELGPHVWLGLLFLQLLADSDVFVDIYEQIFKKYPKDMFPTLLAPMNIDGFSPGAAFLAFIMLEEAQHRVVGENFVYHARLEKADDYGEKLEHSDYFGDTAYHYMHIARLMYQEELSQNASRVVAHLSSEKEAEIAELAETYGSSEEADDYYPVTVGGVTFLIFTNQLRNEPNLIEKLAAVAQLITKVSFSYGDISVPFVAIRDAGSFSSVLKTSTDSAETLVTLDASLILAYNPEQLLDAQLTEDELLELLMSQPINFHAGYEAFIEQLKNDESLKLLYVLFHEIGQVSEVVRYTMWNELKKQTNIIEQSNAIVDELGFLDERSKESYAHILEELVVESLFTTMDRRIMGVEHQRDALAEAIDIAFELQEEAGWEWVVALQDVPKLKERLRQMLFDTLSTEGAKKATMAMYQRITRSFGEQLLFEAIKDPTAPDEEPNKILGAIIQRQQSSTKKFERMRREQGLRQVWVVDSTFDEWEQDIIFEDLAIEDSQEDVIVVTPKQYLALLEKNSGIRDNDFITAISTTGDSLSVEMREILAPINRTPFVSAYLGEDDSNERKASVINFKIVRQEAKARGLDALQTGQPVIVRGSDVLRNVETLSQVFVNALNRMISVIKSRYALEIAA